MSHPGSPVSPLTPLVADASLWIALAATECAAEILVAMARPVIITDIVRNELDRGRPKGRGTADAVETLIASGHVEAVRLSEPALEIYLGLVIGQASETLDDGEAATIAMATTLNGAAVIDERKARRIAESRFLAMELRCTAELMLSRSVIGALGKARCGDALFAALKDTRLRVPSAFLSIVSEAIGQERVRHCPSLPARARTPERNVS